MRKALLAGLAAAGVAVAGAGGTMVAPLGAPVSEISQSGDAKRGAYLARAGGCIGCHSDFAGGGRPLAGGAPIGTGFGSFVPPNITPDPNHGIGAWTREDFARALRQGVSPEGRPYYPAFPYAFFADLSDQDIADLWAAFQTVEPVAEPAPPSDIAFPFDQRWGLKLWRVAFLPEPNTAPVADRSATWNRGRWLAEGIAHCGACHTRRNIVGARALPEGHLRGNDSVPGGTPAPAITSTALADGSWTVDNLAFALANSVTPGGDAFGGGMGEVVQQSTRFLSAQDRRAIAVYLLDTAPAEGGEE